jgi:hypothetical protein
MSTKLLSRRNNIPKENKDIEEIIEIEDNPKTKPIKVQISQKKKENEVIIENSSSEATTPNKKRKNKKKNEDDLIEITDVEMPDSIENKKITSSNSSKCKKSNGKLPSKKGKKTDKASSQTINATMVKGKSKSPINRDKRKKNLDSINLDEIKLDEESEIQITTDLKIHSSKKKSVSIYRNKSMNKNKKISQVKNNKKNLKNGKKYKKDRILSQQIELLSEDSDNEIVEGDEIKDNSLKRKKNLQSFESLDTINLGYYSARKISKRSKTKENQYENEIPQSKSTIKLSRTNKTYNLLGKKRKPERKRTRSITPNKSVDKSGSFNKKNTRNPSQIKANKVKSRTPYKVIGRKNNNKNDVIELKMNSKKNKSSKPSDSGFLNQLADEFGLEKVLDSLCKSKPNKKNNLDSGLKELKDSCDNNRITFLLCKMIFKYFDSKIKESGICNQENGKTTSAISEIRIPKNNIDGKDKSMSNKNKSPSKYLKKCDNTELSVMDIYEGGNPIQIGDDDVKERPIKCLSENKIRKVKDDIKENEEKSKKKMVSIGSHYKKDEAGKVYKFQISRLDGKGNAIFKCFDDKCNAYGIYELDTKKFTQTSKHNLNHGEHEYIINIEKDGDEILKELANKNSSDAQVFKENGKRNVKYY